MTMEALPQDLADFLVTRNFDPEYFDAAGQPSEAGDAKTMKFDYVSGSGKNYGTAVIVVADDELSLFYGDNLGRGMEPEDKQEWYSFLEELSNKAASHSATWSPRDINQLKHTLAGIAAIKEGLFEGYYGNRRVSYMGEQTEARLVIRHNRTLGEEDKRYRYVESLFIETADQERFRLPFRSLAGGRAMLEHVRSGGRPYDIRGNHITEIVSEMAVLSRFNRAQQRRVFEGVTQELVESAREYYHNLQETVKHLGSTRGYQAYFETWAPDTVGEAESLVENLRNLFVEQTLDARIEDALPTLAKIQQQGMKMKEAQIFENWINNLSEGTWALPETPEQQEKLNQLMSSELIVGPDAINATEQLYDLVGDDELFDILNDLADRSEGRANCWDDSDVQRRLAELGIQTPQSTRAEPADVGQDQAPPLKEQGLPRDLAKDAMRQGFITPQEYDTYKRQSNQAGPGKFGDTNPDTDNYQSPNTDAAMAKQRGIRSGPYVDPMVRDRQDREELRQAYKKDYQGQKKYVDRTAPGEINRIKNLHGWDKPDPAYGPKPDETQRLASRYPKPANENAELARMLQHAGVPLQEGVLNDDTGNTWDHLLDRFRHEVEQFKQGDELDSDLYDALFDYYMQHGAMPYGVAKGRTGDPFNWVSDRLADDLGMNENLISPIITAVNEGSCNMTMEGSYCPEHGLAECGGMYEDGGAVGMPYSMGEDEDDFPPVEIRGVGNLINDIPAASKLINPMQPRRSNALSPLEPGDSTSHSPVAHVDLPIDEGVYDPDYRGGHNNEFDELEDLLSKSGMSQDDLMRQRFLASKYGLNTPADMAKLPALKKDAETGYVARKAALDADLEKRNQQYMQDKLTDLEYQQDPVAFLKRRTQQLTPTAPTPPTAPTAPNAPADVAATPGTDYSLPRAKLGSSPSTKLPNFRPEPSAEVPAPSDQTDTRNQKPSIFQQLAQLRNRTRGTMAETSNDDPINSNSAMTGAYYEGKETPTQEGDALLARIKSLALLR